MVQVKSGRRQQTPSFTKKCQKLSSSLNYLFSVCWAAWSLIKCFWGIFFQWGTLMLLCFDWITSCLLCVCPDYFLFEWLVRNVSLFVCLFVYQKFIFLRLLSQHELDWTDWADTDPAGQYDNLQSFSHEFNSRQWRSISRPSFSVMTCRWKLPWEVLLQKDPGHGVSTPEGDLVFVLAALSSGLMEREESEMIHQAVRALTDTLDASRSLREGLKIARTLFTVFY